jgi:hypothetical protein
MYELFTRRTFLDSYGSSDEAQAAAVSFGPGDYEIVAPDVEDIPGCVISIRVEEDGNVMDLSDRDAREP